jgi:hypothetical protein
LGHLQDLTLDAMAYLRPPLAVAALAFALGAAGSFWWRGTKLALALAGAMVVFSQAARLALISFDPYLSSRPLAEALRTAPPGEVVFDNQYYTFSSVFFYANTRGWLLNGRVNNLEYGSYAPGAPRVFLNDNEFAARWSSGALHYLLVERPSLPRLERRLGAGAFHVVAEAGGKYLLANHALAGTRPLAQAP